MSVLKITIIGVGMIGGSLGLALKQGSQTPLEVTGVDTDQDALATALALGAIDKQVAAVGQGVAAADVVFLCTPVLQIWSLVAQIAHSLKAGAIITDVGSTKGYLSEQILPLLGPGIEYIGGHPMAGREKSGISAADGNLFRNKLYILTPEPTASPQAVAVISQLVQAMGAKLVVMPVELHDHSAAVISHIPHVAAAAMVNLLGRYPGEEESLLALAGGGFCDTTRIASSNADMWADICLTNSANIYHGLEQLQAVLAELMVAVEQGDRETIHGFFQQAKERRNRVIGLLAANSH